MNYLILKLASEYPLVTTNKLATMINAIKVCVTIDGSKSLIKKILPRRSENQIDLFKSFNSLIDSNRPCLY